MPWLERVLPLLGTVVVLAPMALTAILGLAALLRIPLGEAKTTRILEVGTICGLAAAILVLVGMLVGGSRHVTIEVGNWVLIPLHYHFSVKFVFDRLSVPFAILSFVLTGTIGTFASRYLHREPGFNRFFVLYTIFLLGMVLTSLAGTIETLFAGWELVGLSSALLVAFYQERPSPPRNGLWVWSVYRVSDAALLLAAVVLHHLTGEGDLDRLLGAGNWPYQHAAIAPNLALSVGLLLLLAAAGKSALVPFCGWLPRAMEGPTPSSAIFYGALSVHLGAYLLLRVSPLIDCSSWLAGAIVVVGLSTAVLAYLASLVQTDIKSALSFSSLTQVGIIVAEVGVGFRYLALAHIVGHACLRTLQFLRAPTLLHDYHKIENAIGERLPSGQTPLWSRLISPTLRTSLYRMALDHGHLDACLKEWVVRPVVRVLHACDATERRWTDLLSGEESRESDHVKLHYGMIDEQS